MDPSSGNSSGFDGLSPPTSLAEATTAARAALSRLHAAQRGQLAASDDRRLEELVLLMDLEDKINGYGMELQDLPYWDARQMLELLEQLGYQNPFDRARLAKLVRIYNGL